MTRRAAQSAPRGRPPPVRGSQLPVLDPILRRGPKALFGTADRRERMEGHCSASKRHNLVPDEPTSPQVVVMQRFTSDCQAIVDVFVIYTNRFAADIVRPFPHKY